MSYINPHVNLVSMIGSCSSDTDQDKEMWLIIEFCPHGDMRTFLIENHAQILFSMFLGCFHFHIPLYPSVFCMEIGKCDWCTLSL